MSEPDSFFGQPRHLWAVPEPLSIMSIRELMTLSVARLQAESTRPEYIYLNPQGYRIMLVELVIRPRALRIWRIRHPVLSKLRDAKFWTLGTAWRMWNAIKREMPGQDPDEWDDYDDE